MGKFWVIYDDLIRIPATERERHCRSVAVDPTLSQMIDRTRTTSQRKALTTTDRSNIHPYWEQSINGAATAVMGDCTDTTARVPSIPLRDKKLTVGVPKQQHASEHSPSDEQGIWRVAEIFYLSGRSMLRPVLQRHQSSIPDSFGDHGWHSPHWIATKCRSRVATAVDLMRQRAI